MTAGLAAGDCNPGATLWVGFAFTARPKLTRHDPPGLRAADGVRMLVELRGGNADAYDIGAVDDALFAFRVDRKGPLLCAADAPGLADAIMADLSGVR